MKDITSARLAQLVAARLNHDYISPLTAIANGLDIYRLDGEQQDEAIAIIDESVEIATKELQFYRVAFGPAGEGETIPMSDVRNRIEGMFTSFGASTTLPKALEQVQRRDAKLWMLTLLCIKSSFARLSQIEIERARDGWKISAQGQGLTDHNDRPRSEDQWLQLAEATSSDVHFLLFFEQLNELNYEFTRQRDGDKLMTLNFWEKAF